MGRSSLRRRTAHRRRFEWESWPDSELLALRMCDLGVTFEGSWLEGPVAQLRRELEARDLRIHPHFWLSDEWFSPDGVPGIAIAFYLAHPRLMRLERRHTLEVEGGSWAECMRILRHEAGHVLQTSFRLQRRRRWQQLFGRASDPYPDYYRPNPASRRYVQNLPYWYAQAHPEEDFAETFAVWLGDPRWRRRYARWPALRKIEYVASVVEELVGAAPQVRSRKRVDSLPTLSKTLGEHYAAKRKRLAWLPNTVYDEDLRRLFAGRETRGGEPAASFLRRHRAELLRMVALATGERPFALELVLGEMIDRARALGLRAARPRRALLVDFAIMLTARTVQYVYRGRDWHAL